MRAILDEAAQVRNNRVPWVFWSPNSHDGRIVNFNQSGVWTPHRCHHHYRTTAHRLSPDVQLYTAELLMNHKLQATFGEVAMGYIHDGDGDFDRMAAANQMIADEIDRILGQLEVVRPAPLDGAAARCCIWGPSHMRRASILSAAMPTR